MYHTTKGIVLKYFKYSEKSVITQIYTEKFGVKSYIIHGIRDKKSKTKLACLQPLSLVEINATNKSNLSNVKTIKLFSPFKNIPFNIAKSTIAFFLSEIIYKSIKEEEANDDLFQFLIEKIIYFDSLENNYANFHLYFLMNFTNYLGFQPHLSNTDNAIYFDLQEGSFVPIQPKHPIYLNAVSTQWFIKLLNASFSENWIDFKIDLNIRKQLLSNLLSYYSLHLSNFGKLKSLEIIEEILH